MEASPIIGEILYCSQEHGNSEDPYAVSVIKDGGIVGHVPREVSRIVLSMMGLLIAELLDRGSTEKG